MSGEWPLGPALVGGGGYQSNRNAKWRAEGHLPSTRHFADVNMNCALLCFAQQHVTVILDEGGTHRQCRQMLFSMVSAKQEF